MIRPQYEVNENDQSKASNETISVQVYQESLGEQFEQPQPVQQTTNNIQNLNLNINVNQS